MAKTCQRLLLFQARRTSALVQSPMFLLSCSVHGMPELVQYLSRPYRKPTCLDRPARDCTCVCDQTWTRQSRSFFLGRPTSSCHVEFFREQLYDNLQKEHERVGSAFQNLKDQNEELARDLAEREADLEELTNLVSTKDEVIKSAERRLLHAKKLIADLKAEVQSLRSRNDQQEPEQQTPQQQSEAEIGRVNSHSLSSIHSRYAKVLQVIDDNRCSMANAFRLAGCPRSTVRDFVAIAEIRIVDHREHDRVIRDHAGSVKELEATCRRRLRSYLPVMANLWREGKLLPLKFDERFYAE